MSHLIYMAHHKSLVGTDHFVALYALDRDTVFLLHELAHYEAAFQQRTLKMHME